MISLRCYCYFWILKFSIESVLEIYVHIYLSVRYTYSLQYQMNKSNDYYV